MCDKITFYRRLFNDYFVLCKTHWKASKPKKLKDNAEKELCGCEDYI